jgi:hypothetical protein
MMITEIQNSSEWYAARRGQIRATDFFTIYNDVVNPSKRNRTLGIEELIQEKVYGKKKDPFDPNYAKNGHIREPAIVVRLENLLECKFQNNQTAVYDNNDRLASSLDAYCNNISWDKANLLKAIIGECKTLLISSQRWQQNLINNCKKWRYQALHHLYCTDNEFDFVSNQNLGYFFGIEFQEYIRDVEEPYFTNNKDFIAINFLTQEVICSDFEHWKDYEGLVQDILKEHLVFDSKCTRNIWEQECQKALDALDFEFSKIEF